MSKHDINANHLIEAYGRLRKASGWKASTQRFEINLLSEVTKLQQELDSQTYKPNKGTCFVLNEQGRLRLIRALEPRDMILEHALCDNILNPLLRPYIIHDTLRCGMTTKRLYCSNCSIRHSQHPKSQARKTPPKIQKTSKTRELRCL